MTNPQQDKRRAWAFAALYLLSPLVLHPLIVGNNPKGLGIFFFAFLCYILINSIILGAFFAICIAVFFAVSIVENKILPEKLNPKTKRVIAILIGVPIGLLLAWIGLSDRTPDGIWIHH